MNAELQKRHQSKELLLLDEVHGQILKRRSMEKLPIATSGKIEPNMKKSQRVKFKRRLLLEVVVTTLH